MKFSEAISSICAALPLELAAEQLGDLGVDVGQPGRAELIERRGDRRPST